MTIEKRAGIWMDHSTAHVMEFTTDPIETNIISSKFTHQEKEHSLGKSENLMHNKEQHQQADYYKQLGEIIKNYEDVILFVERYVVQQRQIQHVVEVDDGATEVVAARKRCY